MYVKVILHHHHHPPPTTKTIITLPVGLLPEVEIWLRKGKTHLSSMWCSQPQMGPKTFVPYCWKQTTPPWCPLLFHLRKIPGKQKYLRLPLNHETGAEREWDIFGHRKYKNGIRQFFLVVTSVLLNCLSVCLWRGHCQSLQSLYLNWWIQKACAALSRMNPWCPAMRWTMVRAWHIFVT